MSDFVNQEKMDAFAQLTLLRNAILTIAPHSSELQVIDSLMEKLHVRRYTLAVVGEFNRGKSSLINALLGMNVLPADITPTTATVNRVVYSAGPYARLNLTDGGTEEIPLAMLKSRVTKLGEEAQSAASLVKEAEIGYPTVFCQNNISILDTPGLNENAEMDAMTYDRARQADALIYTIHAQYPFSESEGRAVCAMLEDSNVRHILFTVGFIDTIPADERERVVGLIRKRILKVTDRLLDEAKSLSDDAAERCRQIIQEAEVLGVSAKMALDAFVSGSMEQLQDSRIEVYKNTLMSRLTAQQDEWLVFEIRPYIERIFTTFSDVSQKALGDMDSRIGQSETAIKEIQSLLAGFRAAIEQLGKSYEENLLDAEMTEENMRKMTALIREQIESETSIQETNEENQSEETEKSGSSPIAGFFQKAKRKVKDWGVYREKSDPQMRGIEIGFDAAKVVLAEEGIHGVNAAEAIQYAKMRDAIQEQTENMFAALRGIQNALEESNVVLPDDLSTYFMPEHSELLDAACASEIRNIPMGIIQIGTADWVVSQKAKQLSDRLNGMVKKRALARRRILLERANRVWEDGMGFVKKFEEEIEALRKKRDLLQSQIDSTQRFLFASQESDADRNDSARAAQKEENSAETESVCKQESEQGV